MLRLTGLSRNELEFRNEDNIASKQTNGRPREIWLIELGFSSDTRYMVAEKKEQHAEVCQLCCSTPPTISFVPTTIPEKAKAHLRNNRKDRRQIASRRPPPPPLSIGAGQYRSSG
jgi:hypothetical protein